jgi:uncharacterized protein YjiS (DUF1127 family)
VWCSKCVVLSGKTRALGSQLRFSSRWIVYPDAGRSLASPARSAPVIGRIYRGTHAIILDRRVLPSRSRFTAAYQGKGSSDPASDPPRLGPDGLSCARFCRPGVWSAFVPFVSGFSCPETFTHQSRCMLVSSSTAPLTSTDAGAFPRMEDKMIDSLRHLLNRPTDRPSDNKRRGDVLDRLIRWRQRRKAAEWLRSMPDYLLKDIGLSRGDIEKVTRPCHEARLARFPTIRSASPGARESFLGGLPLGPMTRVRRISHRPGIRSLAPRTQISMVTLIPCFVAKIQCGSPTVQSA